MTQPRSSQKKLVVTQHVGDALCQRLETHFPGLQVVNCQGNPERLAHEIVDAHIVVGRLNPEEFRLAQRLEWVQVFSAGVQRLMYPEFIASPVILTNGKDLWSAPMAEHVFAMLLALLRSLPGLVRLQCRAAWRPNELQYRMLAGQTVGFLGTGSVARETVRLLAPFACTILGYNFHGEPNEQFPNICTGTELHAMLEQCDVVISSLPATPATQHLMDAAAFAHMKPSALFLNVGRGVTVDEAPLVKALQTGRIAGAGLDVFETEPLPENSALWKMDNVIVSPHVSGRGSDYDAQRTALLEENIARFLEGRPLLNVVDKQAGY
jgi:phosphoglycerate dehydrogenase-like enzyme